jgi:prepilin-type N-terminal cleavage/methylation domain-containing protein
LREKGVGFGPPPFVFQHRASAVRNHAAQRRHRAHPLVSSDPDQLPMMFPMLPGGRKSPARTLVREEGFSLIELLVVLIIIGILAAIGIAAFTGQQNKAHDAEAKAAARSAQLAMETYFVDHRSYSGATLAELQSVQPALADAPNLVIQQATPSGYQISTTSTATNPATFTVMRSANGTITRTCTPANTGGCRPGGVW